MAKDARKAVQTPPRPPVRLSVPIDVRTHAKLCAVAALRGVERSAIASEFIRAGLKDVVVMDSRRKSGQASDEDRLEADGDISPDAEDEAA